MQLYSITSKVYFIYLNRISYDENGEILTYFQKIKSLLHSSYPILENTNKWCKIELGDIQQILYYLYSINISLWNVIGYKFVSQYILDTFKWNKNGIIQPLYLWKYLLQYENINDETMYLLLYLDLNIN